MTPPASPPFPAPPRTSAPPRRSSYQPGDEPESAAVAAAASDAPPGAEDTELPSFSQFKAEDPAGWVALLYAFVQKDPKDTTTAKKFLRGYITERALFRITTDERKDRTIPAVMKAVMTFLLFEAAKPKSKFPTAKQVHANLKRSDGSGGCEDEDDQDEENGVRF